MKRFLVNAIALGFLGCALQKTVSSRHEENINPTPKGAVDSATPKSARKKVDPGSLRVSSAKMRTCNNGTVLELTDIRGSEKTDFYRITLHDSAIEAERTRVATALDPVYVPTDKGVPDSVDIEACVPPDICGQPKSYPIGLALAGDAETKNPMDTAKIFASMRELQDETLKVCKKMLEEMQSYVDTTPNRNKVFETVQTYLERFSPETCRDSLLAEGMLSFEANADDMLAKAQAKNQADSPQLSLSDPGLLNYSMALIYLGIATVALSYGGTRWIKDIINYEPAGVIANRQKVAALDQMEARLNAIPDLNAHDFWTRTLATHVRGDRGPAPNLEVRQQNPGTVVQPTRDIEDAERLHQPGEVVDVRARALERLYYFKKTFWSTDPFNSRVSLYSMYDAISGDLRVTINEAEIPADLRPKLQLGAAQGWLYKPELYKMWVMETDPAFEKFRHLITVDLNAQGAASQESRAILDRLEAMRLHPETVDFRATVPGVIHDLASHPLRPSKRAKLWNIRGLGAKEFFAFTDPYAFSLRDWEIAEGLGKRRFTLGEIVANIRAQQEVLIKNKVDFDFFGNPKALYFYQFSAEADLTRLRTYKELAQLFVQTADPTFANSKYQLEFEAARFQKPGEALRQIRKDRVGINFEIAAGKQAVTAGERIKSASSNIFTVALGVISVAALAAAVGQLMLVDDGTQKFFRNLQGHYDQARSLRLSHTDLRSDLRIACGKAADAQ